MKSERVGDQYGYVPLHISNSMDVKILLLPFTRICENVSKVLSVKVSADHILNSKVFFIAASYVIVSASKARTHVKH